MIETLSISNYALIDSIDIRFKPGFNIITGETGAGKSIMLGALSMLLGSRADTRVVRDKGKKSIVEATFDISRYPSLRRLIEDIDIDWDDRQLILRREISPAGRSRSFINDSPVSLAQLREVTMQLVDLHSQYQNLLLSTPEYQLHIIDTLLPDRNTFDAYRESYDEYRSALKKYQHAKRAVEAARADEDFLRYQLEKLDELNLHEGELAELEKEQEIISNAASIKQTLRSLENLFADGDVNIVGSLRQSLDLIAGLSSLPDAESLGDRIESLHIEARDIAATLESIDNSMDVDPRRLETIDDRLADIYAFQRKHDVDTGEELIALRDSLAAKIEAIDTGDDRLKTLAAIARKAKSRAIECGEALSKQRKNVAESFAHDLYESAVPLGMKNLVVYIRFNRTDLTTNGIDDVTFMFAFNKNQQPMPVRDTASGGEISRLMLSVKAIIAERMQLPSIIFDEIDTGVSGDVANRMGDLMKKIAGRIQVIAITHLPQVASKGDTHFKVFKEDNEITTNTQVKELNNDQRIDELAVMLSGMSDNAAARHAAADMLNKELK